MRNKSADQRSPLYSLLEDGFHLPSFMDPDPATGRPEEPIDIDDEEDSYEQNTIRETGKGRDHFDERDSEMAWGARDAKLAPHTGSRIESSKRRLINTSEAEQSVKERALREVVFVVRLTISVLKLYLLSAGQFCDRSRIHANSFLDDKQESEHV